MVAICLMAVDYKINGQFITIPVEKPQVGGAKVVRLQVVSDNIIRVQATSEAQLPEKQSLIIVKQTKKPKFEVVDGDLLRVKAANVEARVDKQTGRVRFYDAAGKLIIARIIRFLQIIFMKIIKITYSAQIGQYAVISIFYFIGAFMKKRK